MKRLITIIVIIAIALVAVITNPKPEDHKLAVKEKLNHFLNNQLSKELTNKNSNVYSQAGAGLGLMFGSAFLEKIVDGAITRDNYVLFSLTKATWEGKTKTIGVGMFGNVMLSDKIDNGLQEVAK